MGHEKGPPDPPGGADATALTGRAISRFSGSSLQAGTGEIPCRACPIRRTGICAALDDEEISQFDAIKRLRPSITGQAVFHEGEEAEYAYNVLSRGVKLYKSLPDGRTQITGLLWSGAFLGLPLRARHAVSAEALAETELCLLPRGPLQQLFMKHDRLRERILAALDERWAAAQDHLLLLGQMTAKERLRTFLAGLLQRLEHGNSHIAFLKLPLSRSEIGEYLGLRLETVSRLFGELRAEGIIDLTNAKVVIIKDRRRFFAVAGEDAAGTDQGSQEQPPANPTDPGNLTDASLRHLPSRG